MVLIHYPENELRPVGGPSGYLYGLSTGLSSIGASDYRFLPAVAPEPVYRSFLRKLAPRCVLKKRALSRVLSMPDANDDETIDYHMFEAVHFHSTMDLYAHRNGLSGYRGKVVLTSHTPCMPAKEVVDGLNLSNASFEESIISRLAIIDEYAFERADYIVFPCLEAEEPYYHTWSEYKNVRTDSKIRYLPTGIAKCIAKEKREDVRSRYGIPSDAFVICYIGRHNHIKGYDILSNAANDILADGNTWVLIAGNSGPLCPPEHERWIEVGWTDDPHSIVNAADVFVLPNRETYFDLVMLEVLSLGKVVLASKTGGNKFFDQFGSEGILLYEGIDGLMSGIDMLRAASPSTRARWGQENERLYEQRFTLESFARSYDRLMRELL